MTHAHRDELKGTVFRLEDLVEYHEGTIASRMIISNPAGNITLFSFDAGEGLSEHTAPFDAVLTVLDGECRVTIGGEEHHMSAGETVILPAGVPHAVSATARFKMSLTMIRGAEEPEHT